VLKGESSIINIIISFSEGVLKRRTEISLFIRGPTNKLGYDLGAEVHYPIFICY
jgi:hypothetical protein